jgi:4-amino-4-deoxy-L-arabinose transferase-like glycosyltransferase
LLRAPAEHGWLCVLILALWCGALFFAGLTAGELWRTEGLRALIAAEFLRGGNWVVPTLYGEPLFTKPPGMYAAIALVSWPFGGVTEWTARLPSALAGTGCVVLFYWYFRGQFGRPAGLVAALLLPMALMWLDKAPSAEIDALQVFWVTAAVLFFLRALEMDEDRESKGPSLARQAPVVSPSSILHPRSSSGWWLLALLCVAGGVLTKWTAPAFFYGTAVPLLWWRGRLRLLWRRQHLVSLAVAVCLCLAWAGAAVTLGGWEPFVSTVQREAFQRIVPNYTPRPYPWLEALTHPLRLLAASLPVSLAALMALKPGFAALWDGRGRRVLQAMHCWVWPNMLIWSVMSEHTPRHSFPLFPGIAGLAALVWVAWLSGRLRWNWPCLRPAPMFMALLAGWLLAKGAFLYAVVPARTADRHARARGELLASLVPAGQTLYLFQLKDEGIMFYYGRPVQRLADLSELPSRGEPVYCILTLAEWEQWRTQRPMEVLQRLTDQQGDGIVLVRCRG